MFIEIAKHAVGEDIVASEVTPDTSRVFLSVKKGPIIVLATDTGEEVVRMFRCGYGTANALAVSPDGSRLVSAHDEVLVIWSLTGSNAWTPLHVVRPKYEVSWVLITPDGRHMVLLYGDQFLGVRSMEDGRAIWTCIHNCTSFVATNTHIVQCGYAHILFVSVETGKELDRIPKKHPGNGIVLTPDHSRIILSGTGPHSRTVVLDAGDGSILSKADHCGPTYCGCVKGQGIYAAGCGRDRIHGGTFFCVWDINTGETVQKFLDIPTPVYTAGFDQHGDGQRLVAVSTHIQRGTTEVHVFDTPLRCAKADLEDVERLIDVLTRAPGDGDEDNDRYQLMDVDQDGDPMLVVPPPRDEEEDDATGMLEMVSRHFLLEYARLGIYQYTF